MQLLFSTWKFIISLFLSNLKWIRFADFMQLIKEIPENTWKRFFFSIFIAILCNRSMHFFPCWIWKTIKTKFFVLVVYFNVLFIIIDIFHLVTFIYTQYAFLLASTAQYNTIINIIFVHCIALVWKMSAFPAIFPYSFISRFFFYFLFFSFFSVAMIKINAKLCTS